MRTLTMNLNRSSMNFKGLSGERDGGGGQPIVCAVGSSSLQPAALTFEFDCFEAIMPITNVQSFMNHLVLDLKQFDRNISNTIRVLVTVRQRMILSNF